MGAVSYSQSRGARVALRPRPPPEPHSRPTVPPMSHSLSDFSARLARLPFYYGWVVIAIACVSMAVGVNVRTAFSLLFPPILEEFGWERGPTAAAFSVGFFFNALVNPLMGVIFDRFGPRITMPAGCVMMSLGMGLAPFSTEPWHLFVTFGALVVGGGIFVTYIGHSMFLPNWFVRMRGLAIGIAFSGVGIGSMIMFPWLQGIIDGEGWRQACWTLAILTLVLVAPLNAVFQRHHPHDLGLRPDGDGEPGDGGHPDPADAIVDEAWATKDWRLSEALCTARFWWLTLALSGGLFAWYAIQVHQTKYLGEIGFSSQFSALALGLVGLAAIAGQIGIGHFSDRFGREIGWTICMAGFFSCYVMLVLLKVNPDIWLVYLMVSAQGLGYGMSSLYGAIPADIFQGRHYGRIVGTLSIAASFGAGLGPWLLGLIYDRVGSYETGFWISAGAAFVAMFAVWMAAPRKVRVVAGQAARNRARKTA